MSDGGTAAQVVPLVAARALDGALDYAVPAALAAAVVPGSLVAVRLGPRAVGTQAGAKRDGDLEAAPASGLPISIDFPAPPPY